MIIFSLILLQVMIFVGLIVVLRRILTQNVVLATRHLDEMSQEFARKEIEATQRLEEAKQKAQEMINQARQQAEDTKAQLLKEGQEEADKLVKEARTHSEDIIRQAEKSRQLLLAEINDRIAKEAINKACELVQFTLPEQFKVEVHAHWVGELLQSGFGHMARLNIPGDVQEAKLSTAFALSPEDRTMIAKKLKEVLGRDVTIKEEVDPGIVAGIVIAIGSTVLDGSLRNKIRERSKNISHEDSQ